MRLSQRMAQHAVSPYGLAALSLLVFLFAWLFPPALYSQLVSEPDLMFLDSASLLLFLMCSAAFVAGVAVMEFMVPLSQRPPVRLTTRIPPLWFLLLPLIAGALLTVYSCVLLLRNNQYLLEILLSAQGGLLKSEGGMQTKGSLGLASVGLMGITWWALWRSRELELPDRHRTLVWLMIAVATISMLTSALLKLGRGEFTPILAGLVLVVLLRRRAEGRLSAGYLLRVTLVFVLLIVSSFAGFSILRGNVDLRNTTGDLLGYTIASYNRMAAILSGDLHYPFAGHGIYYSAFVAFNHTFTQLFPLSHYLSWPGADTVFRSEFGAVRSAGLNGELIWSGAFGYLFSDAGWFSPFLLFGYGLLTGAVWRHFKLGRVSGVVLYPWFAFCILFWFGTNFLFDTKVMVLAVDALLLGSYEALLVRRPTEVVQ